MPPGSDGANGKTSNGNANLMSFDDDNTENERRLFSGAGGLYEPMWVEGQGLVDASSANQNNDDDFMDLGAPGNLQIRSSRNYDERTQGLTNSGASGSEPPELPSTIGRQDSRSIKIKGFSSTEPPTAVSPIGANPPSASRRFERSASLQTPPTSGGQDPAAVQRAHYLPRQASTPTAATPQRRVSSPISGTTPRTPSGKIDHNILDK